MLSCRRLALEAFGLTAVEELVELFLTRSLVIVKDDDRNYFRSDALREWYEGELLRLARRKSDELADKVVAAAVYYGVASPSSEEGASSFLDHA